MWRFLGVVLCGCGRLSFDAVAADAPPVVPAACNQMSRVHDMFDGAQLDHHLWGASFSDPGTMYAVSAGAAVLTPTTAAGNAFVGVAAERYYDVRGERLLAEIPQFAMNGATSGLQLRYDSIARTQIAQHDGIVDAVVVNPVYTVVGSVPYVPAMRFVAISESDGMVSYETSGDGITFTSFATAPAPFDMSLVRPQVYAGTTSTVAAPGQLIVDSIGRTTPAPADDPACPAAAIASTFDSGVIGHVFENSYDDPCCTHTVVNGQLVMTTDGSVGYSGVRTAAGMDLRGGETTIEIVQSPTVPTVRVSIAVRFDEENNLELAIVNGETSARTFVAGVGSSMQAPRDAAERYLRIREGGGAYFMEVSADSISWRTLRSEPAPFPLDDVIGAIDIGVAIAGAGDTVIVDNYNTL